MASTNAVFIAQDAGARSDQTVNRGSAVQVGLQGGAGVNRVAYFQASTPAVVGTVVSAKLRLRQVGVMATGNRNIAATRVTGKWREDKLTWGNQPTNSGAATATVAVNGVGTDGRLIELDVTADVQKFFDGTWANLGWIVTSSGTSLLLVGTSENLDAAYYPDLLIQWSESPETPTDTEPSGAVVVALAKPTMRWSFLDLAGDTTLGAVQVHLKTANTGWTEAAGYTAPTFDSGTVVATQPQLDLAATAYAGLASGASVWWTVRHRDGAGLWSTWSDPQTFTYRPHQAVALPYPSGAAVDDTTFPVKWTAADQTAYEIQVRDAAGRIVWTTNKVPNTALRAGEVPRGVITAPGVPHTVAVRVWDSYGRQAQPGAPTYVETTRVVTYNDVSDVDTVTDLAMVALSDRPSVDLTWTRDDVPFQFAIWVDGREHLVDSALEFFVSGTSYAYRIDGLAKDVEHTFEVKAIDHITLGGTTYTQASFNNPSVTGTVTPIGVWLMEPGNPDSIVRFLQDRGTTDIVTTDMPEVIYTFEPVGSSTTVQVTTALRAMTGQITDGILADYGTLTADVLRTRLLAMKGGRLKTYVLVWGRQSLEVYIKSVNVQSVDDAPGIARYKANLDFEAAQPSTDYKLT